MLLHLQIEIREYPDGSCRNVTYTERDGIVSVHFDKQWRSPALSGKTYDLSRELSEEFIMTVIGLAIYSWEESYESDELDGQAWTLVYREGDSEEKRVTGYNAYPECWDRFLEITEKVDRVAIEGLRLAYNEM